MNINEQLIKYLNGSLKSKDPSVKYSIEYFKDHGADLNYTVEQSYILEQNGMTPLIIAVSDDNENNVIELLKFGADINKQGAEGYTPLHIATNLDIFQMVKLLIERGASASILNNNHSNILMTACYLRLTAILDYLISVIGVDRLEIDINIQNKHGYTVLMYAMLNISVKNIKLLLKNNPDLNLQNQEGDTILTLVLKKTSDWQISLQERKELFDLMFLNDVNFEIQNNDGNNALMLACEKGYYYIVENLINSGAKINVINNNKDTALILACKFVEKTPDDDNFDNHLEIIKLLVKSGADMNSQNNQDENATSLIDSFNERFPEVLTVLIDDLSQIQKLTRRSRYPIRKPFPKTRRSVRILRHTRRGGKSKNNRRSKQKLSIKTKRTDI
jgi:serine/threonine-protein phosphatase 6 regulatory ankyrin repeat subunit B